MLRTLNLVLLDPGGPSQFGSNYYRFGPSQSKNLSSYNWDPTVHVVHRCTVYTAIIDPPLTIIVGDTVHSNCKILKNLMQSTGWVRVPWGPNYKQVLA